MISNLASPQITAHACGVDDDAPQTEILFLRWVTLTERCRVIFRERRSWKHMSREKEVSENWQNAFM